MLPLRGLSFCCTAMTSAKRSDIEHKVLEMGGSYSLDLMSHINYLIVGDTQTAKYIYCIKNRYDITFLGPNAIDSIYNLFKEEKPIDLSQFTLPIFYNLTICLSHMKTDDQVHIADSTIDEIKQLIEQNGGKHTDSLTVAHSFILTNVCSGKRYTKAVEWGIPVVHPRLIFDSMKRGALMNVPDYKLENYPNFPHVEGPEVPAVSGSALVPAHKDLKIRKNVEVWNSVMNSTTTTAKRPRPQATPFEEEDEVEDEEEAEDQLPEAQNVQTKSSIFDGITFALAQFTSKQTAILTSIIKKNGGRIVTTGAKYTLVPFAGDFDVDSVDSEGSTVKTEWFVERSIFYGEIKDDEWSEPIRKVSSFKRFPICLSGFKGIEQLHLSKLCELVGFQISEKFNSSIQLLFINIEIFKKNLPPSLFYSDRTKCSFNSISYISTRNKINAAKNWKIPILSLNYIFELIHGNNHEIVHYPNLKDLKWCLYYPGECTNDLVSYLNSQSQSSDSFNLPSPKKIQKSFGKLVTNTKVDYKELDSASKADVIDDLNFDLDIGYEHKKRRVE